MNAPDGRYNDCGPSSKRFGVESRMASGRVSSIFGMPDLPRRAVRLACVYVEGA